MEILVTAAWDVFDEDGGKKSDITQRDAVLLTYNRITTDQSSKVGGFGLPLFNFTTGLDIDFDR